MPVQVITRVCKACRSPLGLEHFEGESFVCSSCVAQGRTAEALQMAPLPPNGKARGILAHYAGEGTCTEAACAAKGHLYGEERLCYRCFQQSRLYRKQHPSREAERSGPPLCSFCGGPLPAGSDLRTKYCSEGCRVEARRKKSRARKPARTTCRTCGRPVPPDLHPNTRYCCRECHDEAKEKRAAQRRESLPEGEEKAPRVCARPGCENPLPAGSRANRKYCGQPGCNRARQTEWDRRWYQKRTAAAAAKE